MPANPKVLFDASDAAILLLDHQTGLLQTVKDLGISEIRSNVATLIAIADLLDIPLITTASEPSGPNGPLIGEITSSSRATHVPRKGEISAWDNSDFVKTVEATGKKTLIMAGIWTSVCVAFPALAAKASGYNVYAVINASGDPSEMASRITLARLTQASIIPISTNAVISEMQRTWARPEAPDFAKLYMAAVPSYAAVIESFRGADAVT